MTVLPLTFVIVTTSAAVVYMMIGYRTTWVTQAAKTNADHKLLFNVALQAFLVFAMMFCTGLIIVCGVVRIVAPTRQAVQVEAAGA